MTILVSISGGADAKIQPPFIFLKKREQDLSNLCVPRRLFKRILPF